MAIPPSGTFSYRFDIPSSMEVVSSPFDTFGPFTSLPSEPVEPSDDPMVFDRLAGHSPSLEIVQLVDTHDIGSQRHRVKTGRLTARASDRKNAGVAAVSFAVAKELAVAIRPGDSVFMVRTAATGLGISVVRNDQLVMAVGAVTCLNLGSTMEARCLGEDEACEIRTDGVTPIEVKMGNDVRMLMLDAFFQLPEWPMEIRRKDGRSIPLENRSRLQDYKISILRDFSGRGDPGVDENLAIAREDSCSAYAAIATAELLEVKGLEFEEWC